MSGFRLASTSLACLLVLGCRSQPNISGKWSGSYKNPGGEDMAASLEIKPDETFSMTMVVPVTGTKPRSETIRGSWKQTGSVVNAKTLWMSSNVETLEKVTVSPNAASGDPFVLNVDETGKTMSGNSMDGKGTLSFRRDK